MRLLMPLVGLLMLVVAAAIVFVFKIVWDEHVFQQRLVSIEVTAPEGWEIVPYLTAHGETIVQEPLAAPDAPATTTQRLLRGFETLNGDPTKGAVWSAVNGDEIVVLQMAFGPHRPVRNSIFDQMTRASAGESKPNLDVDIAMIRGIALIAKPMLSEVPGQSGPVPVKYRHYVMRLGDEEIDEVVDITLLSNSSDAAVAALLMHVDLGRANGLLPTPDPKFSDSSGIVTPNQQPLAAVPPAPSIAYIAAGMIADGVDLGDPWMEALARIKSAEITNWDGLIALYPDQIAQVPMPLFELLDDGSQENKARYFAARLRNSDRVWNDHEHYILGKIVNPDSTQADFSDYLTGNPDVADDVMALVLQLPAEGVATSTRIVPTTGLQGTNAILQSGQCRVENGVRSCTAGGN
ncbi:hypothetical protein SAMN04488005_2250 [Yoonia tamlensis]|uniref:Uncharacterized protein n=1 Tax=Yoonia tamlensis TaxID=390270 RepID=A0A1I6GWJ0_9RHOB|nr:hypothetical protein [Yoonia tamlensis]SFR46441.1 hypothetical protein SAMN04488005_2250 [Yoonia tamlensis]